MLPNRRMTKDDLTQWRGTTKPFQFLEEICMDESLRLHSSKLRERFYMDGPETVQ